MLQAPRGPRRWPVVDLVALTATLAPAPNTDLIALISLDLRACGGCVCIDVSDIFRKNGCLRYCNLYCPACAAAVFRTRCDMMSAPVPWVKASITRIPATSPITNPASKEREAFSGVSLKPVESDLAAAKPARLTLISQASVPTQIAVSASLDLIRRAASPIGPFVGPSKTGCCKPIVSQVTQECQRAPVAVRCKCPQSLASWTPAPDQRYVGLDPGLINGAEQN